MERVAVVLQCATCERRTASTVLDAETLRELTGYVERFGVHWCPECAAGVALAESLAD